MQDTLYNNFFTKLFDYVTKYNGGVTIGSEKVYIFLEKKLSLIDNLYFLILLKDSCNIKYSIDILDVFSMYKEGYLLIPILYTKDNEEFFFIIDKFNIIFDFVNILQNIPINVKIEKVLGCFKCIEAIYKDTSNWEIVLKDGSYININFNIALQDIILFFIYLKEQEWRELHESSK